MPQPKKYRWPGGSKVGSVRMRQPPNSMSAVGPPMWVNRVSDMRRNLGASAGMVEIWDGLGLDRLRHSPRHVIARWPSGEISGRPGTWRHIADALHHRLRIALARSNRILSGTSAILAARTEWLSPLVCWSDLRHQYLGRWLDKLSVTAHLDSAIRDGNVR